VTAPQYYATMTSVSPNHDAVRPDPAQIVVPRKHGQVLFTPAPNLLTDARRPTLAGKWSELQQLARQDFLHAVQTHAQRIGAPPPPQTLLEKRWILTGHQLEFYHAGVWAKVVAVDELARRFGGDASAAAFDVLVDHDVVDRLGFDVPVQQGETWQRYPVLWASASHVPADGLHSPNLKQFEAWDAELAKHPQAHVDALAHILTELKPTAELRQFTPWMSRARWKLEQAMGINVHHVPTSLLCSGDAWATFVRAWIEHAAAWTAVYNKHLHAYRRRAGIKNPQHPMPDLQKTVDTLELPFWIYRPGQPRQRLFLRTGANPALLHGETALPLNSEFKIQNSEFVIRPRALTLTMFLRLFVGDLFIHGIGGALYDQITDGILHELFGVIPSYACVSAAWLLPLGQPFEAADDLAALRWRRHHALHNPQLTIDPFTALKTDVAELITQRRDLIKAIADSLAHHRHDGRPARAASFRQLHALNAALHEKAPRILANLDRQFAEVQRTREQNKTLLWREWFFALHSLESLQQLINKVRNPA